jgi:16S rRNA processing protein RimM
MLQEWVDMADRKVCIGVIAGAHGVRGEVRVRSYTAEPRDVAAYGPVSDASGERRFALELTGAARGLLRARIQGVSDRNAAEALRGTELYVDRDRLPEPEADEYYHMDLIGLSAQRKDGSTLGRITAVQNYGAGDMIEIARDGGGVDLVPFTRADVPLVDLERGVVVVEPAHEIFIRPEDSEEERET